MGNFHCPMHENSPTEDEKLKQTVEMILYDKMG
jgi:hypothetical protein